MPDLSDADPTAVALAWLKGRPRILDVFGSAEHVSGVSGEGPWPHLVVGTGPGGSLGLLSVGPASLEVTLQVWSDPSGWPGKAEGRRLLMVAMLELAALPDEQDLTVPGVVPVSRAAPSGALVFATTQAGHLTWASGVFLTVRPPD